MTFMAMRLGVNGVYLWLETDHGEYANLSMEAWPEEPEALAWLRLSLIHQALCLVLSAGIAQPGQLGDLAELVFGLPAEEVTQ